jgi:hypothetical protein
MLFAPPSPGVKNFMTQQIKLYRVKAEHVWGEEKEAKRAKQLEALAAAGVSETLDDGCAYCTGDQALTLQAAGYCGSYYSPDQVKLLWVGGNAPATMFNEKCGTFQPSEALHRVRRVLLLEDACTDDVQKALSKGWQILAIQPQPNQRRPDYILGREQLDDDAALRSTPRS